MLAVASERFPKGGAVAIGLMGGVGMLFNITPQFTAALEYEHFGKLFKEEGTKLEANMVSLGLRYNF